MVGTPLILTVAAFCMGSTTQARATVTSHPRAHGVTLAADAQDAPVNALAQSMAAFRKRVDEYLQLRGRLTRDVPEVKETNDPAKISGREKALGQAIARARASAKPGDLFGTDMSRYLRATLTQDWKSRSAADRQALFHEVPIGVKLAINTPYPTTLPLVSVPAKLLAQLPTLPEELEYRLIDRHLLLRDRDANLIIDMLRNVTPARNR